MKLHVIKDSNQDAKKCTYGAFPSGFLDDDMNYVENIIEKDFVRY